MKFIPGDKVICITQPHSWIPNEEYTCVIGDVYTITDTWYAGTVMWCGFAEKIYGYETKNFVLADLSHFEKVLYNLEK